MKDSKQVQGLEQGLHLSQHMAEHPYLFAGESVRVTFRVQKHLLNDLEDWFGPAAKYSHETEDTLDVTVKVNQEAMFYWALQYAPFVEVLEPAALRQRVGRALREEMCIRDRVDTRWEDVTRFENPHNYYVDLSQRLWDEKNRMLSEKTY